MLKTILRPRARPEGLKQREAQTAGDETADDEATTEGAAEGVGKAPELATVQAPLTLNGLMLLGVFGKPEAPHALVRLPGGQVQEVQRGSTVQGQRVAAIGEDQIVLQGPGGTRTLTIPGAA